MKRLLIALLLLICSISLVFSQDQTTNNEPSRCGGYWKLSYKHPYLILADSLWEQAKFERASNLSQLAAEKFEQEKNWKGLLKARNRISQGLRIASHFDSALSILEKNLSLIENHLADDSVELAEVYFIMAVNHDWQRNLDKSFLTHNKGLEIRINVYGENHIDIARGYLAIGEMYWYDHQYLKAVEYLSKSISILENLGCENSLQAGKTYYVIASAYRELADFQRAVIYGKKALAILENSTLGDRTRCYNLLGNVHSSMQNYEQSNRYNFKAINLLLGEHPLTLTQKKNLANYLNSVANNHMSNQSYDSANTYYLQSLKIYQTLKGTDDDISMSYQNLGINYTKQKLLDSAHYYLSKAVKLRKRVFGEKNFNTSSSLRYMGKVFEGQGDLDSALNYYQMAIVAGSGKGFNSEQPYVNPKPESFTHDGSLLEALWEKSEVLIEIYGRDQNPQNLGLSLETLLIAIELMDRNQELYELEGSTLLMTRDYYGIFEDALDVCYKLYVITNNKMYLERAFFTMEKSKARLLFDSFSKLQKNQMAGIPDSLVTAENSIKSRLASLTRDLENEKKKDSVNNAKVIELEEHVFQSTVDLEHFYKFLETTFPSYATSVKNELFDLNSIQTRLTKGNQVLVDYFWGDSALYSLVLREDQVQFARQPIASIKPLVKKYKQHLLDGPQFTNQAAKFQEFSTNAQDLFKVLFNGVELEDQSLIIATDGPLRFIPFEALIVDLPENNSHDYSQLKYLLHQTPTSYIYSANLWAMKPEMKPGQVQALGFSHSEIDQKVLNGPNELPGTADEIEILRSQVKGLFFSGKNATKQNFIDHAQEYDIIHLAIHGISDSISHLNNRLLFRNSDHLEQTEPLYTYELYKLRLNSKLAVLSACESGIGENFQGEGVYSMSRAFSYAGCPTTVMSLWRITDKTTTEILEHFYKQIFKGEDIDQALRKAKLNYLSKYRGNMAHPGLWAPLVVHGGTDKLVNRDYAGLWILFLTLIIIAFTVHITRKT
jgi:CHAT domain-containing protein